MDLLTLPRAATATALGLGTALRGSRVFHPTGQAHTARVVVDGGRGWGAYLLDQPATYDGVVRVSRGAGLPEPLPDVVGLAIRFPGMGKHDGPLDVLLNTSGGAPGLRHVFVPLPVGRTYSSVLPYRTGSGRVLLLGARGSGEGRWELLAATLLGGWQRWGALTLGEPLPAEESERLRFMPTLGADDLQTVALFRTLRDWSYRQSQAHRD